MSIVYSYIQTISKKMPGNIGKYLTKEENKEEYKDKNEGIEIKTADKADEWFKETAQVGQLAVDVYEEGDKYIIKTFVAGASPEEIKIVVDDDKITINGRRKDEQAVDKGNYYYQECYWGSFERVIQLPGEVKKQEVEAILKNGVLVVKLTKLSKTGPTTIKVQGEE